MRYVYVEKNIETKSLGRLKYENHRGRRRTFVSKLISKLEK
jgi:hypothetical protein